MRLKRAETVEVLQELLEDCPEERTRQGLLDAIDCVSGDVLPWRDCSDDEFPANGQRILCRYGHAYGIIHYGDSLGTLSNQKSPNLRTGYVASDLMFGTLVKPKGSKPPNVWFVPETRGGDVPAPRTSC